MPISLHPVFGFLPPADEHAVTCHVCSKPAIATLDVRYLLDNAVCEDHLPTPPDEVAR